MATKKTKKTKKPAPQPTDLEMALSMQLAELTEDELTADDVETASNAENFLCELMRAFYGRPDIYKVLETAANLCADIQARGEELDLV